MLKKIVNLGKTLTNLELKTIQGSGRPFIGSGCRPSCPTTCASLGGVCVPCPSDYTGSEECRIY